MRWQAFFSAMLVLVGCGGAPPSKHVRFVASSPVAASLDLSTRPRRVTFDSGSPVTVTIVGGTAPFAIAQSNPAVADVSPAMRSGSTWAFTVGVVAGGQTTVTVTDAVGDTAMVPVSEMQCLPPIPAVTQFYPASGTVGVSPEVGVLFVQTFASRSLANLMSNFYARFIGADNSVVVGSHFESTPPPPALGADIRKYAYWRASIPKLEAHVTYRVQFASAVLRCLPPALTGDFTTR